MLPTAATEFYRFQLRVNEATQAQVRQAWKRMGDDFDASWRRQAPVVLAAVVTAQQEVTQEAARYVPRLLEQVDISDEPMGEFRPSSLVGRASDGRPLDTLAYGAVTAAKTAIGEGATTQQALAAGGSWLNIMAALQVADAARQAVSVQTASQRKVSNYVRVLTPPSCQRCAILAGRVYKWSTGFLRHPGDDCVMMPARNTAWAKSEGFVTDPMDAYRNGQIKDLTKAQAQAIEDGADIGKVVNAYKGVSTTATRTRTVTKRLPTPLGVLPGAPDLLDFIDPKVRFQSTRVAQNYPTPEGIYQQANGDRDVAVRLLREFGYLA